MDAYQIPRLASRYMHHDMIEKYADLPEFPHLRTRLLHIFLQKGGIPSVMGNELYALVTSLLQLGLDTHDRVDNDSRGLDDFRKRAMQLKVLAGDYFSSRFYYLLSQAEQIDRQAPVISGMRSEPAENEHVCQNAPASTECRRNICIIWSKSSLSYFSDFPFDGGPVPEVLARPF